MTWVPLDFETVSYTHLNRGGVQGVAGLKRCVLRGDIGNSRDIDHRRREMAKRKADKLPERRVPPPADHYPGLHGKVVDWAAHRFVEGGLLFLRVHFTDHTELCWSIRTATVIAEADLCDWKTGDEKQLKVFTKSESD